jgi:transcription-repair coupling factor (superfamily II helicase)
LLAPDEIDDLAAELEDRFGPLPPPAQDLLSLAQLRLLSRSRGSPGSTPARARSR